MRNVREVHEIVAECTFRIEGFEPTLRVKAYSSPAGSFFGIASHYSNGNYLSMQSRPTVQEAIEDALNGFLAYWRPGETRPEDTPINENY